MEVSTVNANQRSLATYHVHHHLNGNFRILVNVVLALQREKGSVQHIPNGISKVPTGD